MAVTFSADEILEIAEQIERDGAAFYRRSSEGIDDEETRELLLGLVEWEEEHLRLFASMREKLSSEESPEWVYDPNSEAGEYLPAFAEGQVFDLTFRPAEALSGSESPADILRTAIGLERDSIVFYLGIEDAVPEALGKEQVREIIQQEKDHIVLLSRRLKRL